MSIMGQIKAGQMQWYAVRIKRKQIGGIRTTTIGGQFEGYRDRQGRARMRRLEGTGQRVFVPEHLLRRAGFEVFLPVKKELRLKNRFTKEKHLVTLPLLADWLFVGWPVWECKWARLMELDVVTGVLGTGGRPVSIVEKKVAALMQRWGGGLLTPEALRYSQNEHVLLPGGIARVLTGPFVGFDVRVIEASGPSARVAVNLLGKEIEAEFDTQLLEVPSNADLELEPNDDR